MQFTGQERDQDLFGGGTANLPDYFHARYYDVQGRFLSVDSHLGDPANPHSWNRYDYARGNPIKFVDPNGRDIELAGTNQQEIFTILVLTAQHPQGRADLAAIAANHNFTATYHDERINSSADVERIRRFGSDSVTLATTAPNSTRHATAADVAIDAAAVHALHPDRTGITTLAHEDKHVTDLMNGVAYSQIVASDRTRTAELYGASVASSQTDMSQQQAEVYVTYMLYPSEEPRRTDVQRTDMLPP